VARTWVIRKILLRRIRVEPNSALAKFRIVVIIRNVKVRIILTNPTLIKILIHRIRYLGILFTHFNLAVGCIRTIAGARTNRYLTLTTSPILLARTKAATFSVAAEFLFFLVGAELGIDQKISSFLLIFGRSLLDELFVRGHVICRLGHLCRQLPRLQKRRDTTWLSQVTALVAIPCPLVHLSLKVSSPLCCIPVESLHSPIFTYPF